MGLLGKITGAEAANKAAGKARKDSKLREQAALGELTPQAMQAMMNMFMQKYMAMLAPNMMSAQQGLAAKAGRSGMMGSGLYSQLQAGIPGQFANAALSKATESGMGVASQRANTIMGRDIVQDPGRSGLGDSYNSFHQLFNSFLGGSAGKMMGGGM